MREKFFQRKQVKIILISALATILVLLTIFFITSSNTTTCKDIKIKFTDNHQITYIDTEDIKKMIISANPKIIGTQLNKINLSSIEELLNNSGMVKNSQVYTNIDGSLNIEVAQREPIVKIITDKNKKFYIDSEGFLIPVSKKYPVHILVATGNITIKSYPKYKNVLSDSVFIKSPLNDIYKIAFQIKKDEFFKSMVQQIFVNPEKEIELIPRVGNHTVLIGNGNNCEDKLQNLKIFYSGTDKLKWNNYKLINIKFSNQIVCTNI